MECNLAVELIKQLEDQGWCEVAPLSTSCQQTFEEELLALATQLGTPVSSRSRGSIVEKLTPLSPENANPRSLSKQFGIGAFPLHTDCAHWTQPPHYIILASRKSDPSNSATILLDTYSPILSVNEKRDVSEGLFQVSNGRHSFFCSMQDIENRFIRFDSGCMSPQNDPAVHAMNTYSADRHIDHLHEIYWSAGQAIIIDNWRVVHGRRTVDNNADNREIWRVLVK